METKGYKLDYKETGIKTLIAVSYFGGLFGVLGGIIILITGFADSSAVIIASGIFAVIFSLFFSAAGRVLATIAEIKLIEYQSKTN